MKPLPKGLESKVEVFWDAKLKAYMNVEGEVLELKPVGNPNILMNLYALSNVHPAMWGYTCDEVLDGVFFINKAPEFTHYCIACETIEYDFKSIRQTKRVNNAVMFFVQE